MKRVLLMLFTCILTMSLISCGDADKYDKENYIGAADVEKYVKDMGITREEMSSFTIDGDKAYMNGDISKDTIRQIKKLIKDYPNVKTIVMQYVGGSVDDVSNLKASRLVREAGLNTHVPKDGLIASGGTDFFCAGVNRTTEEGAQIGVHSWAGDDITNAAELPREDPSHQKYIDYYKEMEMPDPEGFYFFTINAAVADDMHFMTVEELQTYGLVTE